MTTGLPSDLNTKPVKAWFIWSLGKLKSFYTNLFSIDEENMRTAVLVSLPSLPTLPRLDKTGPK